MMRQFTELIKNQTPGEKDRCEPEEIIRVDSTGKNHGQIISQLAQLRSKVDWTPSNSKGYLHKCHHDETPPSKCERIPEDEL